tara:strand:- start:140 stop:751 length:612 start_codon:yes stop_codon:yes gene_type:complete
MKFSATFDEKVERSEEQGDQPLVSSYLNPGMVDVKKPAHFALLEEDPLMFFQTWGEDVSTGGKRPFRFTSKPTEKEVMEEMGKGFKWGKAYGSDEKAPVKEAMAWPVYDFDNKAVRVFSCDQFTIQKAIKRIASNRKYKNLLNWDLCLTKINTDGRISYDLQVEPRDDEAEEAMESAWADVQKKGFDIKALLVNGDPFNPEGN